MIYFACLFRIISLDFVILTIFAVENVLERHNGVVVNEHDILNLLDGITYVEFRPVSVFLKHMLKVNALLSISVKNRLSLDRYFL